MNTRSKVIERMGAPQRGLADRLPKPKVDKIVKLSSGDPAFPTANYILEAAYRGMRDGYTHYPSVQGDPQLQGAIAAYQSIISRVPISPAIVLATGGSTRAITAAMMALLDEGTKLSRWTRVTRCAPTRPGWWGRRWSSSLSPVISGWMLRRSLRR